MFAVAQKENDVIFFLFFFFKGRRITMACLIVNVLVLVSHGLGRWLGWCSCWETVLVQAFLPDSSRNSRHMKASEAQYLNARNRTLTSSCAKKKQSSLKPIPPISPAKECSLSPAFCTISPFNASSHPRKSGLIFSLFTNSETETEQINVTCGADLWHFMT